MTGHVSKAMNREEVMVFAASVNDWLGSHDLPQIPGFPPAFFSVV
jgi:hypothetical protein